MSSNDDMLVRKVEQQLKNESFLSAMGCLLPLLISPIVKIKEREPGPITSCICCQTTGSHISINFFRQIIVSAKYS
ncbi:unnamed protein product [Brugia pahangi]|uniref:Mitochondrial import receptor subunit TOM5 homolog n=1 Tax=Brugia pahangi TaxID=6280 RepID=A0A0N4TWA7_BRUPA|nr:unnamed protein product [Brugia pahangi]